MMLNGIVINTVQEKKEEKFMNFGEAVEEMKVGEKVARKSWNGKDMYIFVFDLMDDGFEPCIVMKTAQGLLQPGWLASQADILAEDWYVVE